MSEQHRFVLMNKDIAVLQFTSETDEYGDTFLEAIVEPVGQLPIGFMDIHAFIAQSQAPKHSEHIF